LILINPESKIEKSKSGDEQSYLILINPEIKGDELPGQRIF
jgi:hypothetical protein